MILGPHIEPTLTPTQALETLKQRILVDGFHLVADLPECRGSYLRDGLSGRDYLDFYSYFASHPITYHHPRMLRPEVQHRLQVAATSRVANSDVYTQYYAEFVATLERVAGLPGFEHYFFIDGGALANENALKVAFDWKVRKNLAAGRGELGTRVLHFKQAFHGRSGYTMSLTNTDPAKVLYFPKFDWPRIDNPVLNFDLSEPQRSADVAAREAVAVAQIEQACNQYKHDIAAMIIEPIQGEGGDNHFRGEFLRSLRDLADRHDFLLIFDEIQTGVGLTGRMWCCQHFDVFPDILVFGKKMQQCGLMCTHRVDDVDNVFKVPSRINSTWGGNLVDMVRATEYLRIIAEEKLVERAAASGEVLLEGLQKIRRDRRIVSNVRGRGLMCAFNLPDAKLRDRVKEACQKEHMLVLSCGPRSIRFRPVLDIARKDLDAGLEILERVLKAVEQQA